MPLLEEDKAGMEANLRQLEDRVSRMKGDIDGKGQSVSFVSCQTLAGCGN